MERGMNLLAAAIFALFAVQPAWAQNPAQVRGIDVVEFGIYTADILSAQRDSRGVMQTTSTNFRQAVATTVIPAQIGVRFGFRYVVAGDPQGGDAVLKKVVIYPPAGVKSPMVAQPLHRSESAIKTKAGETSYTGYKFDDAWELVPGPWTIELWSGDRKLAQKTFTVVAR
jgi:hypothetical protein